MSQINEVDDPGGRFSVEIFPAVERKKKEAKKKEKGRPVENDAPDGNPTKQDFHSGLQNPSGFAHFPPAPPPAYQRYFSGAGLHLKEAGFLSEEWGAPQATRGNSCAVTAVIAVIVRGHEDFGD